MGQGQSGISYVPDDNPIAILPGMGILNPVLNEPGFRLVDKNVRRYYLTEDNSAWLSLGAHCNIMTDTVYPIHIKDIISYFLGQDNDVFGVYLSLYDIIDVPEDFNCIYLFLKNNDLVKVYFHIMNKINVLEGEEHGCAFAIHPDIHKCLFSKMNYPTGSSDEDIDQFMDESTKVLHSPVHIDFDRNYDDWKKKYVFVSEYLIFLEKNYEQYFSCMIQMITDSFSRYLYITISKVLYDEYLDIAGSVQTDRRGYVRIKFDWFSDSIEGSINRIVRFYTVDELQIPDITTRVEKINQKLQLALGLESQVDDLTNSDTLQSIYERIYGQLTEQGKTNLPIRNGDMDVACCVNTFSETWLVYRSFYSVKQISDMIERIKHDDSSTAEPVTTESGSSTAEPVTTESGSSTAVRNLYDEIISKIEEILRFSDGWYTEKSEDTHTIMNQRSFELFRDGLQRMKEILEILKQGQSPKDEDEVCVQIIEYMKTQNSIFDIRLTSFEFYSIYKHQTDHSVDIRQCLTEYHQVLHHLFLDDQHPSEERQGETHVYWKAPFSNSAQCVIRTTNFNTNMQDLEWARVIRTPEIKKTLVQCPYFLNRIICQLSNPSIEKYGEYRCVFVGDDVAMIFDLSTKQIVYCSKKYMEVVANTQILKKPRTDSGEVPQLYQLGRIIDGYYNYKYLTGNVQGNSQRRFVDWPTQPTSQIYCSAFNTFKSNFITPLITKCKELSQVCETKGYTAYKYSRMDFVMKREFGGFRLDMPPCNQFILNEIEDGSFGHFCYINIEEFLPRQETKVPESTRYDDRGPIMIIQLPATYEFPTVFPTLYIHYEKSRIQTETPALDQRERVTDISSEPSRGRVRWRHPEIYHSRIFGYMKGFVNSFTQKILQLFQLGEDYTGIIQEHFYEIYLVFAYYSQNKHPEDFVDQHSFDAHPEPPEFPTFLDRVLIEKYPDIQRQSDESDGKLALRIFETVYKPRTKSAIKQLSDFPYYEHKGVYPLEFKVELYDNPYTRDPYIIGKFLLRQQGSQGQTASGYSRKKRRTARKRKTKRKQTKRRRVKQRKQTKRRRTRTKKYRQQSACMVRRRQ